MKNTYLCLLVFFSLSTSLAQEETMDTNKTTTMKIGMTSVYVHNPIEAFKFYTDTLGFIEILYMQEAKLAVVASPQDKNGTALLLEPNDNPIAKTYQEGLYEAGIPVIVFITENIYNEYKRLKDLGVVFRKDPTETEWGIEAIFNDNSGNWIQLQQIRKGQKKNKKD
jgi:catechol 2,3-dioxygenase-like lactoylglutathione lyase family enzyme